MRRIFFIIIVSINYTLTGALNLTAQPSVPASADTLAARTVNAQTTPMTLDECMLYAIENSPGVKKQVYQNDSYAQTKTEAVASLFPSLNVNVGGSANYGLSIDPLTNTKTQVGNYSNTYSVSAGMYLFDGLSSVYAVRAAGMSVLMGKADLELAKDNAALAVMRAYFDAVYYWQAAAIAEERFGASAANYQKSIKLEELGLVSYADVLELEAQMASDDYLLTRQRNNYELAMITLRQAMNYPLNKELDIVTNVPIDSAGELSSLEDVVDHALRNDPRVMSANSALNRSRFEYSAAKGSLYPSLHLSGGISTSYAHYEQSQGLGSFGYQFKNNYGYGFSLTLSIPIFNGMSYRTSVNRQRNSIHIAEQTLIETEQAVQVEIVRNYQEMQGYGKEFLQASKKVDAASQAHRATEQKFELGKVSSIELQTSANRLLEAQAERLNARLQYIIRCRLMEYYGGGPLVRE